MKTTIKNIKSTALVMAFCSVSLLAQDNTANETGQGANTVPPTKPAQMEVPVPVEIEAIREAGNKSIEKLMAQLAARQDLPKRIAIIPLQRDFDGDYFSMQLKNQFSQKCSPAGYQLYTRQDEDWNRILSEVKMGQMFGDTMDPATIQKFGKIQGVEGVILGRISGVTPRKDGGVKMRVSMQVFQVETGRMIFGAEEMTEVKGSAHFWEYMRIGDFLKEYSKHILISLGVIAVLMLIVGKIKSASRPR